jgi:hypothetical protein
VDVLPRAQIHHVVRAPADRPHHLLHLFLDELVTAELPMFALIFTRKFRPMIMGSISGWLMFAGIIARPRATSSRTNSGVIAFGRLAPQLSPGVLPLEGLHHLLDSAGSRGSRCTPSPA